MVTAVGLVSVHHHIVTDFFFQVLRTVKISSLSNFRMYNTVLLTRDTMLFLTFPGLIYLVTGSWDLVKVGWRRGEAHGSRREKSRCWEWKVFRTERGCHTGLRSSFYWKFWAMQGKTRSKNVVNLIHNAARSLYCVLLEIQPPIGVRSPNLSPRENIWPRLREDQGAGCWWSSLRVHIFSLPPSFCNPFVLSSKSKHRAPPLCQEGWSRGHTTLRSTETGNGKWKLPSSGNRRRASTGPHSFIHHSLALFFTPVRGDADVGPTESREVAAISAGHLWLPLHSLLCFGEGLS